MAEPNIRQEKSETSDNAPSRNNSALLVSEILKRANLLIQKGELSRAQGELLLANQAAKERYTKYTLPSPVRDNFIAPPTPLTPLPLAPMEAMMAAISSPQQVNQVLPRTTTKDPKTPSENPEGSQPQQTNDRCIEFLCYREALAKAWADGALSKDEERQLQELRTVLEITDAEHEMCAKEIKRSCYKEALAKHASEGSTSLDTMSLVELQKAFQISQEDHAQIQSQFVQKKQKKHSDKILIIDDDAQFLNMLTISMTEDGFDVTAVATSDEAYALLKKRAFDLILCDINLKTSTMNGFILYEKVQSNQHLQHIPFVFITGLKDENLAITGKELGADDFLMKPISRNTLLSTLHGRLKRFKQLRDFSSGPTPAFC